MSWRTLTLSAVGALLIAPWATAQEPQQSAPEVAERARQRSAVQAEDPAVTRLKEAEEKDSRVMETLSYLTDVIGPRLTASPQMKRANEWTRDKLAEWGLHDAHLEAWGPFGRGWTLRRFSAQVVEPQCIPLIAYPKAWSPGTDGPITADVVHLDVKKESDLERFKGKLKGKIVLIGNVRDLKAWLEAPGQRLTDARLLDLANAPEPAPRRGGRRPGFNMANNPMMALMMLRRKVLEFVVEEGAAVAIDQSNNGDGGTLFVAQASVPGQSLPFGGGGGRRVSAWDKDAPKTVPQVTCSTEQFNRMIRMIRAGEPLRMTIDLDVAFHDGDLMGYNTVAEVPGSDLKDELVMLGGHMDSWHSGTGATDNAAGVAVCMEAVRLIRAAGLKPRRTIRIALWSGEEQGLLGSRAYVKEHFGERPEVSPAEAAVAAVWGGETSRALETRPDYDRFAGYFNLDNGTGKVRGVYQQGNAAVGPIFRRWLAPFKEKGAATLTLANTGGTDHQSFDAIGLPGFQFIQDPVEYETRTHHSNQDVYDRIQADDMKQASVIMAAFVYQAATADEKLPRKPMPERSRPSSTAAAQ